MIITYSYIFSIGLNTHEVCLYSSGSYSKDLGLIGKPLKKIESSRFTDCVKAVKKAITGDQYNTLVKLCRERASFTIIGEDCKVYNN